MIIVATWWRPVLDIEEGVLRFKDFRVAPGKEMTCTAESAEKAAEQCPFVLADDVANNLNADEKAEYETMFTAVAKSLGDNSRSVSYELTEAATNALQEAVNDAQTAVLDAMTDPAATTATVAAKPGFYYAIEYGSDLNLGANTEGQMAKGSTVKLDKPQMSAKCGFFRVKVSPSKIDSSAPAPVSE